METGNEARWYIIIIVSRLGKFPTNITCSRETFVFPTRTQHLNTARLPFLGMNNNPVPCIVARHNLHINPILIFHGIVRCFLSRIFDLISLCTGLSCKTILSYMHIYTLKTHSLGPKRNNSRLQSTEVNTLLNNRIWGLGTWERFNSTSRSNKPD